MTPANENQPEFPNFLRYRRALFRTFRLSETPTQEPHFRDAAQAEYWLGEPSTKKIQFPTGVLPPISSANHLDASSDLPVAVTYDLFYDWLPGLEDPQRVTHVPPPTAEFILGFLMSGPHQDAMLGDLKEKFSRDCKLLGSTDASRRYWWRQCEAFSRYYFVAGVIDYHDKKTFGALLHRYVWRELAGQRAN